MRSMDAFEMFTAPERVIVSPAAGVFEPLPVAPQIAEGAVIGHVVGPGKEITPVRSPFAGLLCEVVAWRGERVAARQRLAWLRVAG